MERYSRRTCIIKQPRFVSEACNLFSTKLLTNYCCVAYSACVPPSLSFSVCLSYLCFNFSCVCVAIYSSRFTSMWVKLSCLISRLCLKPIYTVTAESFLVLLQFLFLHLPMYLYRRLSWVGHCGANFVATERWLKPQKTKNTSAKKLRCTEFSIVFMFICSRSSLVYAIPTERARSDKLAIIGLRLLGWRMMIAHFILLLR